MDERHPERDELDVEEAAVLPPREAMSLITPDSAPPLIPDLEPEDSTEPEPPPDS
jgi:hypothetical protein